MHLVEGVWVYSDTGIPVSEDPDRPCGCCGLPNTVEGYDGCLGFLPDVVNACCGHGQRSAAYVQFPNGDVLQSTEALEWIYAVSRAPLVM